MAMRRVEQKASNSRGGTGGPPKRRCRYGMDCRNLANGNCKFAHPPASPVAATTTTGNSNGSGPKKSVPKNPVKIGVAKRDRSKIQCRYGMECRNTKCPFFHHPAAATVSPPSSPKFCTVIPDANKAAPPHARPILPVMGESDLDVRPAASPARPNGKSNAVSSRSRKATTKKKCRWGAGCINSKCHFLHPGQDLDEDAAHFFKAKSNNGDKAGSKGKSVPHPNMAKEGVGPRPQIHPILPPSPETHDQLNDDETSYPATFLPPLSKSARVSREPTQQQAMPITRTKTQTAGAVFNSGFSGGNSAERTPLYNKALGSFNPYNNDNRAVECYAQLDQHHIGESRDQPPDAEWLYEVLGLNTSGHAAATNPIMESAIKEVVYKQYSSDDVGASSTTFHSSTTPAEEKRSCQNRNGHNNAAVEVKRPSKNREEHGTNTVEEITPTKKLICDEELVESRQAALELMFESQQKNAQNPEMFYTLLQECRSKQNRIKTVLEQSMEPPETGTDMNIDESNVVALLELNELIVEAIDMAESSLQIATENGIGSEPPKSSPSSGKPKPKESEAVEQNASSPSKQALNKNKKGKKSSQPKSVKMPNADSHKSAVESATGTSPQSMIPAKKSVPSISEEAVNTAQEEKEKIARMLEEARQQSAAARERKKNKKSKKFDRWLRQNEEEKEARAKSWSDRITKEKDYIDLIQKILVAEFLRQSKSKAMGLTSERVLSDSHASVVIAELCRQAYDTIYGGLQCRAIVAGSENKDLNGRQGTIRYWDKEKEKFCVGLDTRKSADSDVQFLPPEVLDLLKASRPKPDKKSGDPSYDVNAPDLLSYGGVSLGFSFTLLKLHIVAVGSAESTKIGLAKFCSSRDADETKQKQEEEAEKKKEEEDRKRRAARKERENAAWKRRKEQMRKDKEDYEKMKKEWKREGRCRGSSFFDFMDGDDDEECQCPRCRYGDRFSSAGGAFFFNIGGIPFRVRFGNDDSEDEDSFFDEFDERWEEQLAEEKEEENRKHAGVLGVDSNADVRTIKMAYRKMALQYHPDKWKTDSDHGMSKGEAEDRFKAVQAAYDHMMSNFDD